MMVVLREVLAAGMGRLWLRIVGLAVLMVGIVQSCTAETQDPQWSEGAGPTKLPPKVESALANLNCQRTAILRGEFKHSGEKDLAVVCGRDSSCHVFIFSHKGMAEQDELPLPRTPPWALKEPSPFRLIDKQSIRKFMQYYARYPGEGVGPVLSPRAITHDGIEELLGGGATEIHYFSGGKWIVLPGMD